MRARLPAASNDQATIKVQASIKVQATITGLLLAASKGQAKGQATLQVASKGQPESSQPAHRATLQRGG